MWVPGVVVGVVVDVVARAAVVTTALVLVVTTALVSVVVPALVLDSARLDSKFLRRRQDAFCANTLRCLMPTRGVIPQPYLCCSLTCPSLRLSSVSRGSRRSEGGR